MPIGNFRNSGASEEIATDRPKVARALLGALLATLIALPLGGCAVNRPMSAIDKDPAIVTGSISEPTISEDVEASDAETIRMAVGDATPTGEDSYLMAWNNPQTGNSGTISAIEEFAGGNGQTCRKFVTTLDSFSGVALYEGEACEAKKGNWLYSWLRRGRDRQ